MVGLELDDEELDFVEDLDARCLVVREGAMRGGVQGGEEVKCMYVVRGEVELRRFETRT